MSQFVQFKQLKIHYTDEGKGTAIVLLHGFLENSGMWQSLKKELLKRHRVVCIDLLGHGLSGCLGYIHTMHDMAEAVYAVVKSLRLRRIVLIGHSMGGYVSLALAENHPNLIKKLCLMNSTAYADTIEKKKNRDRAIDAVKQNHKTFVRLALPNLFAEHNRQRFKSVIDDLINEALMMKPQGIVAALEGMKQRPDRQSVLKELKAKKLIIVGRQDPVLAYKSIIKLAKETNSSLVELPDGHMSHIENIEEFTYIIMHFIEN